MAKRMMSFELSEELRAGIKKEAFRRDISSSELIRRILAKEILNDKGTNNDERRFEE